MSDELKTKVVTIDKGRDAGKSFLITEMPLLKADKWARRFALGMMRGGVQGDINSLTSVKNIDLKSIDGILEIAKLGVSVLGNIEEDLAMELIDELTHTCIQIIPTGGSAREVIWESDIKDVATLMLLRKEALGIHVDFLEQGNP